MHLKKYQMVILVLILIIFLSLVMTIFAGFFVTEVISSPNFPYTTSLKGYHPTPTPFQPNMYAYQIEDGVIELLPQPVNTPTPVPTIEYVAKPEDQLNVLLLGSDSRNDGGYRTDVIMLVSINPEYDDVSIISFPRDLYVNIPGWQMDRINTVHQIGGFQLLADTFEINFGIRPDNYAMVDFDGFYQVIDTLGGIDLYAEERFEDQCNHTLSINSWCIIDQGWNHMDSELALWYSRARYSTSDFDRGRRTQEVVKAIFEKLMRIDAILKAPELWSIYTQYVETDLKLGDVLPYISMAKIIKDSSNIRRYAVGPAEVSNWFTGEGAMVLLPNYYAIYPILVEALHLDY